MIKTKMIKTLLNTAAVSMLVLTASSGAEASIHAPGVDAQHGTRVTAAKSPTMWPPAETVKYASDGVRDISCYEGYICFDAWDPNKQKFKVFYLRKCSTRALHNFGDSGLYKNNQTTGTVTRFLDKNGKEISRTKAKHGARPISYLKVKSIDVC